MTLPSLPTSPEEHRPFRYGAAVLTVAGLALARWLLDPLLGPGVPFILFFPAVMLSAWIGGLGPGVLATVLSAVVSWYLFLPPAFSFELASPSHALQLALFVVVGLLITLGVEALHRARRQVEAAGREGLWQEQSLRQAQEEVQREEEEVRHLLDEQVAMVRIASLLAAELDFERLVQVLTDEATAVTGAGFGAFFYNVTGERGESYMLYALSGAPREAFANFPTLRNTEVFGPTFRGEGIVRSDDITRDPRYGRNAPYHGMPPGHLPVRSYLAAPVVSRSGAVLGGLFLGHPEPAVFDDRAERILSRIAVHAAIAFDNARLYQQAQEARAAAEAASRSKDEFLATVSHELRTPLNAMLGWAQLLQASPDPERLERGLDTIIRNARLQTQLIDDLLDVSRIISGKMRLDVRTVDLAPVIEAAIEAVRPAAEARQIRLVRLLDPQAGPVAGDSNRLQQVVWNLLANAVRFTPKEGRVEVRLERVDSHVEIVVADTGIGIRPELMPHVFERFLQGDSSTTRRHGGLGLGLAIVRHLTELHGGTVEARSPGEGKGATFVVRLPLSIAHPHSNAQERVHPRVELGDCRDDASLSLEGVRVLIVDDEADARETLTEMLEHCGAEILAVASAREALAALARFRPHVLLCDIGMPEQDGYALIRQVRELPAEQGGTVPAAALTAYARGEDRRRALRAGFQMHLAKPVQIHDLTAVVASLARSPLPPAPSPVRPPPSSPNGRGGEPVAS